MAVATPDAYTAASGQTVYGGRFAPVAPGLPAWVQALPLWTWSEVPNSKLSDMTYTPSLGYVRARIDVWCGAALKRQGSQYLIGAAGGHGDYAGNEVTSLNLNSETPAWTLLRGPSANADIIDGADVYLDYRRAATHTYYGSQFLQSQNRLVILPAGGMGWVALPDPPEGWPYVGEGRFCSFSLDSNDWEHPSTLQAWPGNGDFTACLVIANPLTDEVLYGRNYGTPPGKAWKYRAATNDWVQPSGEPWAQGYAGAALDLVRGRALMVGGFNGSEPPQMIDFATAGGIAVSFGGLGANALKTNGYPGVVYDEANDCFLVFRNSPDFDMVGGVPGSILVHRVDAGSLDVSAPAIVGSIKGRNNGIQNSVQYVPELKGVVIANDFYQNVKFMRTAA